jgi:hypothetical protein
VTIKVVSYSSTQLSAGRSRKEEEVVRHIFNLSLVSLRLPRKLVFGPRPGGGGYRLGRSIFSQCVTDPVIGALRRTVPKHLARQAERLQM